MNKFNVESAKFVSIIIAICFIFIMVIWHAFDYLPSSDSKNNLNQNEVMLPQENKDDALEEEPEVVSDVEEDTMEDESQSDDFFQEEKKLEKVENSNNEPEERHLEPLEPIEVDTNNKLSDDSKTETLNLYKTSVAKADEAFNEGIYQEAIKNYQKAYDLADNNEEKALCYEGISNVYAKQKRYGSALSYAQKAYNMYPNTSREILLARLYYKTGDLNRATIRMNNVLKRDF